jgi:hypothetical protein
VEAINIHMSLRRNRWRCKEISLQIEPLAEASAGSSNCFGTICAIDFRLAAIPKQSQTTNLEQLSSYIW